MTIRQYIDLLRQRLVSLELTQYYFQLSNHPTDNVIAEQINLRNTLSRLEIESIVELCLQTHVETLRGLK